MKKPIKGMRLWDKAKKIIPGGTQLLSKRSELHLPKQWPSYFKKARGVEIVDLDDNTYIDMSLMGVGTCTLGYADPDVNKAVKKVVDAGNMTTLNSPEEIELTEVLLKLHPWAQMARFARSGGEAVAIAIRIGRAYTKKDKVAFCGYHGWSDWYLAANLARDKNLDGHLLPGLNPLGVPRGLLNTALPFEYNNVQQLQNIIAKHEIGTIIMEPMRHTEPKDNFLQKVRDIANKNKIVLIFDEISSGFRSRVGGAHLIFGVTPDIAVFGKAMSNGYPMAAVIGKRKIMDTAQDTFISSTYWTERIGPAAALATIKKMAGHNVPAHLDTIGKSIGEGWEKLAKKHRLNISVHGPNPLITISFEYNDKNEITTLFVQEMLKRGFLAFPTIYVSYAHTPKHVRKYLGAVDEVFNIVKEGIDKNKIPKLLKGPTRQIGFKRLT
jgi:glutamate-1-semialdehyde aminotransferase